ncbi:PTS lactose transporter subunit IIC [Lysinibacillus sphaericus]|uniref:PTS sugar transporter subunit IIC n=1 Tax=Lysinibacillus sphaericus TaxID=1421 RepID=UPI0018CE5A2C|nr:PTS sugar transporter subunit IIC [Lysinibacillus sphaericus]MBG9452744.1 PTS lactose transporter subunit IIC [Lysinibacillus sphaericus]MBG9479787.1 PTS lactose transporter subunit IIC [Lysinibacillus sphaericus]MBG9595293.1 PTS lactose transporter subunit IIC [Lysinibacillus sphaericus]
MFRFLEEKFVPVAARVGNQRHLVAIRDGFITIMPLTIVGSLAVLVNNLPIKFYQNALDAIWKHETWTQWGGNIWGATFGILSLLLAFTIAYNLAKSYDKDGLSAGVISLSSYMTFGTFAEGGLTGLTTGTGGLFIAIIVALLSTEVFCRLSGNPKLLIKMPNGVPPAVSKSFAALLPAIITIGLFALVRTIISAGFDIPDIVGSFYTAIQEPFMGLTNTWVAALVLAFIPTFLWTLGVHGANIIEPFMQTINLPAIEANVKAISSGEVAPYIVNKPFFDAFINMGGSGTTIALIIAIFIIARKNKQYNTVGKLSAAPGLFNINEPLLFGLPIVLNPVLFVPFILTPMVNVTIAFFATKWGFVPAATVSPPWTTPPIINGFLATQSWQGAVLSIVLLIIAVCIYLPFISMANRVAKQNEQQAAVSESENEQQVTKLENQKVEV